MRWTLGCAQLSPTKGNVPANLDAVADAARQASAEGVDVLVFPETVTSGYILEGGVLEHSLRAERLQAELHQRLTGLQDEIDLVVGFYEEAGGNLYNSAAYLHWNGSSLALLHVYRKFFLPTYGVFDEERFVARGTELGLVDTRFGRAALLICEDIWHSVLPTLCALGDATLFYVLSASPARGFTGPRPSNVDRYSRLIKAIAEEHGVFCANAMLTGFEGGKGFVGSSLIVDPFGAVLAEGPLGDPALVVTEIDPESIPVARAQTPLQADLRGVWENVKTIAAALPR